MDKWNWLQDHRNALWRWTWSPIHDHKWAVVQLFSCISCW